VLEQLESAISKTVNQFQNYPLDFLSERDIQALLFVELRNETREIRYSYDAEGANRRFGFSRLGLNRPFRIHPVTTEYYIGEGKRDRFDVAVLSDEPDSASDIWRQPCRVAIEIKLWQPGYGEPGYRRDVEKLQQYQSCLNTISKGRAFTGIAILFVHPCAEPRMRPRISTENSGDAYPENGIALHFVTREDHWWKEQYSAPTIPEQVAALAQTT
jgi:hypothetical protein